MDQTENIRRILLEAINSGVKSNNKLTERFRLEQIYDDVYDTKEATEKFEFIGFLAPFVAVKEKSTGLEGTLKFQDMPRFYFDFVETEK